MNPELVTAAFLVGLMGGVHCAGMCGGIVGALTSAVDPSLRESRFRFPALMASYNLGRIASYVLAGLLVGLFGEQVIEAVGPTGRVVARSVAAVFMILFGIYIAGWGHALLFLERVGAHAWKVIEPLGRRFLPVRGSFQALCLGMVWGWLPCGMVYAVLVLALSSATPAGGALVMLAFGLGTLPLMLAMGLAFNRLGRFAFPVGVRRLAGILVIGMGAMLLLAEPGEHGHHSAPHDGQAGHHAAH